MVINRATEKEGTKEGTDEEKQHSTPNKVDQLNTIPETPDTLLSSPKPHKPRQRRRAVLSSSEDEVEILSPIENTPRKSSGLFSDLPFSKRFKKDVNQTGSATLSGQGRPKNVLDSDEETQSVSGASNSCRRLLGGNKTRSLTRTTGIWSNKQ